MQPHDQYEGKHAGCVTLAAWACRTVTRPDFYRGFEELAAHKLARLREPCIKCGTANLSV